MRRGKWIVLVLTGLALTSYLIARASEESEPATVPPTPAASKHPAIANKADLPAVPELPITQITLYSSGVGKCDRVVLVEHPLWPEYHLNSKDKPLEKAAELYRFENCVAAGKTVRFEVVEETERPIVDYVKGLESEVLLECLQHEFKDATARAALEKLQTMQENITAAQKEIGRRKEELAAISADQDRLRANLKEMPAAAAAYKRYLEKFDAQETAIEQLQKQIQEARELAQSRQVELDVYLTLLDIETLVLKTPPMPPPTLLPN